LKSSGGKMSNNKNEILTPKEIYAEIGANYRFFLNWRHALFIGYLAILLALANASKWLVEQELQNLSWLIFLIGFFLSLCFWGLERRIRDLYRACTNTGAIFEKSFYQVGIYMKLDSEKMRNKKITHSFVLDCFFIIVTLSMFVMLIVSVWKLVS
jgi:hypothetical protein